MAEETEEIGYKLKKKSKQQVDKKQQVVTPVDDEGGITVATHGYYGTYVDIDASIKSESDLITRYREISNYTEVDTAIEEIVTEMVSAMDDEPPIVLELEKLEYSESLKNKIQDEFEEILKLLDFKRKGHDIARRWYIDGRLNYQKIINLNKKEDGIKKLVYIDPRKIKKLRNVIKKKNEKGVEIVDKIDEFYVYNDKGLNFGFTPLQPNNNTSGIRISLDAIASCSSGLYDLDKNIILSFLHKALKPVNQLKMMMDSLVIYRASRAPERRIFYIDTGNLPKNKAEEYMKSVMAKYKNKIVYDADTGRIKDNKHFMSMLEDFWMPVRADGRGTKVDTLRGAENLGNVQDVEMFQEKVYRSLNIPLSRFKDETNVLFGRQAEISREELKFSKFINRLRRKFNDLFNDLLKTNLLLKNIIKEDDWEEIKENIYYKYTQDQYFQEIKEGEILRNRVDLINQIQPYVGMYFSLETIQKKILRMTDEEIKDEEKKIQDEIKKGKIMPPQEDDGESPVGSVQAGALTKQIDND